MTPPEVHLVAGTRTEAVKLAPVAVAIRDAGLLRPILLASGQHPTMVHEVLTAFGLTPDRTMHAGRGVGTQVDLLTAMVRDLDELWAVRTPAAVIVQGDTTTSLAGALAAYWRRIPVVHLEAGQRCDYLDSPFPAEAHRRLVAQVATLHLVPTPLAAMNLLDERITASDVLITGNTVVDATLAFAGQRRPYRDETVAAARASGAGRRLVLVAAHRRESSGDRLAGVLAAVRMLVERYPDIDVILTGHPNPAVRAQVADALAGTPRITVADPLSYPDLARLLSEAYLVLTDSATVEEAAPSFGVPALVLRDIAERVEALHAGYARPVGWDTATIVQQAAALLDSRVRRSAMTARGNPHGDGLAARRAAQATAALLGLATLPAPMPSLEYSWFVTDEARA